MLTLRDVKCGQNAVVVKLHGEGAVNGGLWTWGLQRVLRSV